jgi:hypothetical protein
MRSEVQPCDEFGGEKPASVVGEPVLREDVERLEETGAVERLERRRRRGARLGGFLLP